MTVRSWPGLAGGAVAVAVALVLPLWIGSGYYLQLYTLAYVHVILALGLNVILGFAGQLALAHAGLFGVGAYTSALLVMRLGLSFWVALPLAAVNAALFGAFIGFCALRLKGHYLAIATAGFGIIIYQVFANWITLTRGAAALTDIPVPDPIVLPGVVRLVFETRLAMYYLILVATVLAVLVTWRLKHSRVGDALLAIREDEVAAEAVGVDTFRYKLLAFVLSALYAGAAGSLYAHYTRIIAPEMFHLFETVTSLLIVVAGGLGSIGGVVAAGVFFSLAPEILRALEEYRMVAYGALLVVVMVFLPEGVAGGVRRLRAAFRSRARTEATLGAA